ncbi:MAG: FHA domain-containing protein [Myxococcota bacterium]|nr:FHA domain-containing protein [Myxococcota bacterium]
MLRLVILSGSGKATVFPASGSATIGRGEECDLVLPNVSVSRVHARITVLDPTSVQIEDLDSNNGISINGKKTQGDVLSPGDEVLIGRYTLVLVPDSQKFFQGRYVAYLPEHGSASATEELPTFTLDSMEVRKLEEQRRLIREAKVILASSPQKFWHPEDHSLTFGKKAMVAIEGMFSVAIAAEISWDGNRHVITRRSSLVKLRVNSKVTKEAVLQPGNTFQIGSTSFVYQVPD